ESSTAFLSVSGALAARTCAPTGLSHRPDRDSHEQSKAPNPESRRGYRRTDKSLLAGRFENLARSRGNDPHESYFQTAIRTLAAGTAPRRHSCRMGHGSNGC